MKDRIVPCKYYEAEGSCSKGYEGTFKKYCQHCKQYKHMSTYKLNLKNKKKSITYKLEKEGK